MYRQPKNCNLKVGQRFKMFFTDKEMLDRIAINPDEEIIKYNKEYIVEIKSIEECQYYKGIHCPYLVKTLNKKQDEKDDLRYFGFPEEYFLPLIDKKRKVEKQTK